MMVVCSQSYRVDPYSPAKIMENRVRPGNWPDWAVFGSEFTTVDPDGILIQVSSSLGEHLKSEKASEMMCDELCLA
ncbi:hypothetical protein CDL15_Pgr011600 [Punica granatum]|uniref:Uncharacterized protein n=1 Tax=Punica granatum TaxID=22663 RepID=A0A218Y183_PUNGR|nr:hypothetical protein CDL15_Pgr011600 [Punica granatum]